MPARIVPVFTLLVCLATPAAAQTKTDVVTLRNGDRITGDIVKLSRGRLEVRTNDIGTVNIEWDNVAKVEAARYFEVVTTNGSRYLGSLGPAAAGSMAVVTPAGPVTLTLFDVISIAPIGASFWTKLDGSINAGFSYTQSSGIAQTTFNSDANYRQPSFLVRLTGSATVTEQEGQTNDDRAASSLSYVRYRGARWFIAGSGRFENNQSLGIVLRSQVGGVVGQRLANTNRFMFQAGGGLAFNNEQAVDTPTTQNLEGVVSLQTSYYTYDAPSTTIDASFFYYPSLSQWGRQRVQIDTSLKREILKDLTVSLSLYYTFDSDPPQAGAARTDVGLVTSVGWTFGR